MPRTFGYFKEQWLYSFPWMQLQEMNNAEEWAEMSLQTLPHLLPSCASPLPPSIHYSKVCFSVGKRSLEPGQWGGFWGALSIPTLAPLSVSEVRGWVHSGCTAGPKEGELLHHLSLTDLPNLFGSLFSKPWKRQFVCDIPNLSSVTLSQRETNPSWFHQHVLGEFILQGNKNGCPAAHTAQGASWKAGCKLNEWQRSSSHAYLQWSVPWLPGDRADGFPFQKKQRAETWDVSCVSLIYSRITPIRHSQTASQQDTHSKIRDLMVFVEEGTTLPLLGASGAVLAQHHCDNATSSIWGPHISWAALGICFSCPDLITCLKAAASTSKRSKTYSVWLKMNM